MTLSVTILGATGSIGCSTIDLLLADPDRYRVRALVGGRNAAKLAAQARALQAEVAVIADSAAEAELARLLAGSGIATASGARAVEQAGGIKVDWTMAAITGAAGLAPTLAAIRNGRAVALANKEALVCAGEVMLQAVKDAGCTLLPVDSEHNAIFQSMADGNRAAIEKIVLTASGGPFRTWSVEAMARASAAAALKHPIWSMGAKISIDSATLMNKGLELIEAARLFDLDERRIEVLVHPQSVVHGMVQYADGSVIAQLGAADMRIPIAHALAWPERIVTRSPRLDLAQVARLEFYAPDHQKFPALELARAALRLGGGAAAVLSAANEVAVAAFLAGRIGFLDIARLVADILALLAGAPASSLEEVVATDRLARERASAWITRRPS